MDLLVAVALRRLRLVEPLEGAVVALVEPPALLDRQPEPVEAVEGDPEGADRPLEQRGVGEVEVVASLGEQPGRFPGLFDPLGRKVDVGPAGEAVFEVPGALAVAQKDELVHAVDSPETGGRTGQSGGSLPQ